MLLVITILATRKCKRGLALRAGTRQRHHALHVELLEASALGAGTISGVTGAMVPATCTPTGPIGNVPVVPVVPTGLGDVVPIVDAVGPDCGSYVGGDRVRCGLVIGSASEAALPGATVDRTIAGFIIVIGPAPTPPPVTQPDIVTLPVVDEPKISGRIGVTICAEADAVPATKMRPMNSGFIAGLLDSPAKPGHDVASG